MRGSRIATLALFEMVIFEGLEMAYAGTIQYSFTTAGITRSK
jgi:hypothetical protein